ncbi:hypothetical protein, partial [Bacillus pseudomycoides]|uniref:hypothetical protein n=1 Tax=Bacillus pseudomycoides TaxID=64104 RepID=UPI000C007A19
TRKRIPEIIRDSFSLCNYGINMFATEKWFYVNLTCMEYTSNFYDKSFLPNGTIKEEEGYYEETSF